VSLLKDDFVDGVRFPTRGRADVAVSLLNNLDEFKDEDLKIIICNSAIWQSYETGIVIRQSDTDSPDGTRNSVDRKLRFFVPLNQSPK
jgi:hypothetical protein